MSCAPQRFAQVNAVLTGTGKVGDLPVYRDGEHVISCWRLGWFDRLRALLSGRVWVVVLAANTHPPILLLTSRPFERRPQ